MEHEGDSRRLSRADRRFRRHAREQIGVSAQPLPFTGIQAAPVEEQQHTGWKIGMPDLLHGIQGFGQHEARSQAGQQCAVVAFGVQQRDTAAQPLRGQGQQQSFGTRLADDQ